ncbi:Phosphate metabolism transcription protein [Castilleja foliolosa]|uniref:Phosphate metabolism transcription protein n=1 Tax=Castilleja foliolosa TaxID=1961234 RepID=A0ABD3C692_9LAMI
MVAISLYKGNLHKVPDVPRRWTIPPPKISAKTFRILLRRRSRALSRLLSSSHYSDSDLHAIESCAFKLLNWRPFTKTLDPDPPARLHDGAHSKRPCLADRATSSFSIDAILDMSKLSLFDDDKVLSLSAARKRWFARKRRRRCGSRSLSDRSSDRRGYCSISGNNSNAMRTRCSDRRTTSSGQRKTDFVIFGCFIFLLLSLLGLLIGLGAKLPLYAFKNVNNVVSVNKEPRVEYLSSLFLGEWEDRMQRGLFRYDVTSCETKVCDSWDNQIYCAAERVQASQEEAVDKVLQPFDENKFSFTKIGQEEVLFQFHLCEDTDAYFIPNAPVDTDNSPGVVAINVSPIEYGHVLLIPRILECLPQRIDRKSFLLALHWF